MKVASLSVNNVRSYELYTMKIHPQTTLIIGKNGSGKTTLLEALYFMHRGTSFRGRDRDMLPHSKASMEIKLELVSGEVRRAKNELTPEDKIVKQFTTAGTTSARLSSKHKLPVVLFEPDELRLLTSSPSRRRDFIDGIIARLSPTYMTVISRFQRTLLQRNELLKQSESMERSIWESHLFAWDVKLSELSASIIKARTNFLLHSNEQLPLLYSLLAGSSHVVTARYVSSFTKIDDGLQQTILHKLEATRQFDGSRGFTSVGPHRDDIELLLDGHIANETASRGEMRTIMLAFKLLEVELQEKHSGEKPLILLDDVFSELDIEREEKLVESLNNYQTIITSTDARHKLDKTVHIIQL